MYFGNVSPVDFKLHDDVNWRRFLYEALKFLSIFEIDKEAWNMDEASSAVISHDDLICFVNIVSNYDHLGPNILSIFSLGDKRAVSP